MVDTHSNTETGRHAGTAFMAEMERDKKHREKARDLKPLRRLWPFLTRYKGTVAIFLFFLALAAFLNLALTFAVRLLVGMVGRTRERRRRDDEEAALACLLLDLFELLGERRRELVNRDHSILIGIDFLERFLILRRNFVS